MKDFIYNNRAEALKRKFRRMPPLWYMDNIRAYQKKSPYKGDAASQENPSNMPSITQPSLSLAYVSNTGKRTVLTISSETWTPELSQEEYMKILNDLKKHRKVSYQLLSNSEGAQQLVVFRLAGPPDSPDGLFQAGNDTDLVCKSVLAYQLAIFAGLSILALAGGLSLYLPILLRNTLTPLSRIVKAAQRTDAVNLTERLPISQGQQEIDLLSEAFNGMLGRSGKLLRDGAANDGADAAFCCRRFA